MKRIDPGRRSRRRWPAAALATAVLAAGALGCSSSDSGTASKAAPTTDAAASSGCGRPPAVRGMTAEVPGDVPLTLDSGGVQRSYRLGVPDSYDRNLPTPLVLSLHGSNSSAILHDKYTDIPSRATARGMITVTPDAIAGRWDLVPRGFDDRFLVALVKHVERDYCIDLEHVHIVGLSLGAWKAAELACAEPGIFASIGLVALEVHPSGCPPMPVIAFHGTDDRIVPYGAGGNPDITVTGPTADLPGTRDNIAAWASGGGCSARKRVRHIGGDVELWTYPACASGVDVELYTIYGGGHSMPGAPEEIGPTSRTISAVKLVLDFFAAHPLTRHR